MNLLRNSPSCVTYTSPKILKVFSLDRKDRCSRLQKVDKTTDVEWLDDRGGMNEVFSLVESRNILDVINTYLTIHKNKYSS